MAGLGVLTDPNAEPIERETMRRVTRRLIPLLMICYFVGYLDRVNVSFASLTMNRDLHLSPAVFGFGGGIFFLGYFLFEVPSNLMLERVGARTWIARILVTWGIISACTATVVGEKSFYGIRFLLGLAEAGFYPGIILYLTWWFPSYYRSRIIGLFMTAIPISVVLGSIVSGWILSFDQAWGLAGWQWLFVIEGVPAAILGVIVFFFLTDQPEGAHWLAPEQRTWLAKRIAEERAHRETVRHYALGETLRNGRVWGLTLVYFGQNVAGYGLVLFLPQIIKRFGVSDVQTGLLNAIPFVFAAVAMVLWGLHSDRTGRAQHALRGGVLRGLRRACGVRLASKIPYALMVAIIAAQMGQSRDRAHLLDAADGDAVGNGGGGRHRAHQRGGQSGRLRRPLRNGSDPWLHGQLRSGPARHLRRRISRRNRGAGTRP